MAEFRSRGLFWWREQALPENMIAPDISVAGELSIGDEGNIELALDGFLDRGQGHGSWAIMPSAQGLEDLRSRIIEGRLIRENQQVLLFNIKPGSFPTVRTAGISTDSFSADHCLVSEGWGVKWLPKEVLTITLDLTSLLGWVRFNPFQIDQELRDISFRIFEAKVYETTLGRLTIDGSTSSTWPMPYENKGRFDAEAWLTVDCIGALDFSGVNSVFRLLQELFIILTDSEYCLPFPRVMAGNGEESQSYKFYCARLFNDAKAPDWYAHPLNLDVLSTTFGDIVDRWFSQRERFGPGYYLYLGTRRGMSLYTENLYWSLITGLESFHSTKFKVTTNEKLQAKITRIVDQIEQVKDRQWANKILMKELAPKLHERVTQVVMSLPVNLDETKVSQFSQSCASRRNDLAHYGGNRYEIVYSDFVKDLAHKIGALITIYHVLMLQEIGVEAEQIRSWLFKGPISFRRRDALVAVGLLTVEEIRAINQAPA